MRRARIALAAATLWSLALLVAALTVPVYSESSSTTTSDGSSMEETTSATLVEVNGTAVLVTLAIPLVASLVVAVVLFARQRVAEGRGAWLGVVAWLAVAVCGALALLGLLSIGVFVLPVAVALAVAVITSSSAVPRPKAST
jgi:hypothetical protein